MNHEHEKHILHRIEERLKHMATKSDLDAVIAGLPAAIESAVETALVPVIQAIKDSGAAVELQPEIDQLNALGATVASKVAADLTPTPPAPTSAKPV